MTEHDEGKTSGAAESNRKTASKSAGRAGDTSKPNRGHVANALDSAADLVDREGKRLPAPLAEYADEGKERLTAAADYVRDHDGRQMARDAVGTVKEFPIASLLIAGSVVVGGGLLIARLLRNEGASDGSRAQSLFGALSEGWGPKTTETVTRLKDAVFAVALMKAVDALEDSFPGFREHFERA